MPLRLGHSGTAGCRCEGRGPEFTCEATSTGAATSFGCGDHEHPLARVSALVQAVAALTITDPPDSTAASAAREQLEEVLTRWGVNPRAWLVQLAQLERRSTRALGTPQRMVRRTADVAQHWLQGISLCREIFAEPRSPAAHSTSSRDDPGR